MRKVGSNSANKLIINSIQGCIPADEMKFVLEQLPGGISYREIEEMINTVDRNGDGKISFSEFRSARPVDLQGFPGNT